MTPASRLQILPQPDDTTCGPTCLHAVYRFWGDSPRFGGQYYRVGIQRVLGAILLGVLTYDANFLVIEPPSGLER